MFLSDLKWLVDSLSRLERLECILSYSVQQKRAAVASELTYGVSVADSLVNHNGFSKYETKMAYYCRNGA